jgi:hypothetical protein
MKLDLNSAERLLDQGRFLEITNELGDAATAGRLSPALSAVVAHALYYADKIEAASHVAHNHASGANPRTRARFEIVLGLTERRHARPEDALRYFRSALQTALAGC